MIDLKAHGLRVKPLEWEIIIQAWNNNYEFYRAGYYEALLEDDGRYVTFLDGNEIDITKYASLDEAKAACQAHHESQVLALLESIEGGQ